MNKNIDCENQEDFLLGSYRVVWEIDVDAESHVEAAKIALGIQRDPESVATFYEVTDCTGDTQCIDLNTDSS